MGDIISQERSNEIFKISIRNIVLNSMLACIKIFAGLLSNSLAVLSDGFNSLSDVATTIVVLISGHFTKIPRDKEHQYGHEKFESVATLIIALFLGAIAVLTIYESIWRLIRRETINASYFALGAALLSAGVKYYMYRATGSKAKELKSDALNLVAVDFRFDVFLSCSVFIGVLFAMRGFWFFEPAAAIFASVPLLTSAAGYVLRAFNQLVDKAANHETLALINQTVLSCRGVRNIDLLMTRLHGNYIYVDIEISVDPDISVREGHLIAQCVHNKLEEDINCNIKHCNVHVNPYLVNEDE